MKEEKENKMIRSGNQFRYVSTVSLFLLIIFGFTAASMVKEDRSFSDNENRVLQQKPIFSVDRLVDGTFGKQYESYVTDQFVGRDEWIGIKVYAEKALQKKEINGIYFGKDHYLIQQHEESDVDEDRIHKNLDRLHTFIKTYEKQASMHVMIVPTSSEVLKDKLPAYAPEYDQTHLLGEIQQTVGNEVFIPIADTLDAHKEEYIYYKTDHHWTSLGAYYAYVEAASKLGFTPLKKEEFTIDTVTKDFLGTTYSKVNIKAEPDEIQLYKENTNNTYEVELNHGAQKMDGLFALDKLEQKDKYPVFLGGNNAYVEITGGAKNHKTLLVIKDSFAHTFVPFLAAQYEKIIMIDYRYYNESTKMLMEKEAVTDVLFLYNTMNFAEDKNLLKLLK